MAMIPLLPVAGVVAFVWIRVRRRWGGRRGVGRDVRDWAAYTVLLSLLGVAVVFKACDARERAERARAAVAGDAGAQDARGGE